VALRGRATRSLVLLILCGAVALSFCSKPIEPSVEPPPVDASKQIQAIQVETERRARQVSQMARQQVGPDVEKALKAIGGSGESPRVDESRARPVATEEVAGKLERATPDFVVIRDDSGFAYWLRTSGNTQVTANGQPARLTDFRQGADVRASFTWQGKERVATEVDVLGGQVLDGGVDGGS